MKRTALKRKTPLKSKTPLKTHTQLKSYKKLKSKQKTARKRKEPYHSIFTENMHACYITGATDHIEPHHIFGAANKALSEKYGFILPLRSDWHRNTVYSIHEDKKRNVDFKMRCQEYYINKLGKTWEEWQQEFGKRWVEEDKEKNMKTEPELLKEGQQVFGLFKAAESYTMTDGIVTKITGSRFEVDYKMFLLPFIHEKTDIGRTVFTDGRIAEKEWDRLELDNFELSRGKYEDE